MGLFAGSSRWSVWVRVPSCFGILFLLFKTRFICDFYYFILSRSQWFNVSIESASTRGACRVPSICRQSSACIFLVFKMFKKGPSSCCDLNFNSIWVGRILNSLLIDSFFELIILILEFFFYFETMWYNLNRFLKNTFKSSFHSPPI